MTRIGSWPETPRGSLLGVASLKIDVVQTPAEADRVLTFRSLGVEPQLAVTLVNQWRMSAPGLGIGAGGGIGRRGDDAAVGANEGGLYFCRWRLGRHCCRW